MTEWQQGYWVGLNCRSRIPGRRRSAAYKLGFMQGRADRRAQVLHDEAARWLEAKVL